MTHHNLTCAELDERLGDYLEGTLDDSSVAELELHLSGCVSCASLVRDFERISREAAALPALAPSRDLWQSIASRLDAPAIDLVAHRATRRSPSAATHWRRLRTGALAAGLVGITAFTTYVLSRRSSNPVVGVSPDSAIDASSAPRLAVDPAARTEGGPVPSLPEEGERPLAVAPIAGASGTDVAAAVNRPARRPARATYDAEISALRGMLTQRREELDPRTIAILESSISTIDSAISEARRALNVDPASRFLSTQLNKALQQKLGLLRTAALLPART